MKSEDIPLDSENQKEPRHYIWFDTVGKPGKSQKRRRETMDKQPRSGASNHHLRLISWSDTGDSWGILRRPFWRNPHDRGWIHCRLVDFNVQTTRWSEFRIHRQNWSGYFYWFFFLAYYHVQSNRQSPPMGSHKPSHLASRAGLTVRLQSYI